MLELRKRCKGFVVVISPDARTRMMAMVLSTKTVEQNKCVRILLCDPGGELALKDSKSRERRSSPCHSKFSSDRAGAVRLGYTALKNAAGFFDITTYGL